MQKTIAAEDVQLHELLAEIKAHGTEFIVTKGGTPVALIGPAEPRRRSLEELHGSGRIIGDIMEPIDPDAWTFDEGNLASGEAEDEE
jgi:antitoxin (DNA-binding transcriptional repressor) of toxin-antitoxin stability system